MREDNPLIDVSMQIILAAGDARNCADKALDYAEKGDFINAEKTLIEANENINKAHKAQTGIIQAEMSGENYEECILFSHAQDTLMTIMSEVRFASRIVNLYKKISESNIH